MAVNNGNLHKLPLKSTLNLNRFENEINDWKQYVKLNSPVYGGVLSNFYEKDIELSEGEKFITYDKQDKLWTKKYNENTTNTDVFRDGELIYSFSNETAIKEELQKDYAIASGTKDYPIYESSYEIINSYFLKKEYSFMDKDLMLVAYKSNSFSDVNVDLFECENGERTKVKTYSFSSTNITNELFINAFVNANGVLFFSVLPMKKIEYDDLFSEKLTYAVCLLDNTSADKYDLLDLSIDFSNEFILTPTENNFAKGSYVGTGAFEGYYSSDGNTISSGELTSQAQIDILSNSIEQNRTTLILDENECLVVNNKLICFTKTNVQNSFGIEYGKGECFTEITKTTFLSISGTSVTLTYSGSGMKRIVEVNNIPVIPNNTVFTVTALKNFINDAKTLLHTETSNFKFMKESDDSELRVIDAYWKNYANQTFFYYNCSPCGVMYEEIEDFKITFDLSPIQTLMRNTSNYRPVFHGTYVLYGVDTANIIYLGSDYKDKVAFFYHYNDGITDTYRESYDNSLNFKLDNLLDKKIRYMQNNSLNNIKIGDVSYNSYCFNFEQSNNNQQTYYYAYNLNGGISYNSFSRLIYANQCVGELNNYKIPLGKLGATYTLGYVFAITRGITNLVNNQINSICSYEHSDDEDIIYYKDYNGNYCCIRSLDATECIKHQVVDDFIIFETSDYSNNNFNTIDMVDVDIFNIALDWNSRNSLFFGKDCGYKFEDNVVASFYKNNLLSARKDGTFDDYEVETTLYILFVSSINEHYLAVANGIGADWCSSLVGVQFLKNIPSVFLDDDTMNNNGYFGFNNSNVVYLTDDENDYSHFYINNYLSGVYTSADTVPDAKDYSTACKYRFSMPNINPDLEDLVDQVSYPLETNVLLNVGIFDKFYTSFYAYWFVKVNNYFYTLQINGTTNKPVFAYELLTQALLNGIFVINGSTYGYNDRYIMPISFSDGVISQSEPIINIYKLEFISNTPNYAYFFSKHNRSIYVFSGNNTMTKLFESNRITTIDKAYYNSATQDIWVSTNDGTLIINSDNTFIKIDLEFDYIGILKDVLYVAQEDNAKFISYNYKEDYDKLPIELETEFYGVDDFTTSINDCVYIRLVTDEEHNDFIGNVELSCETLTQISKKSETKLFHIEKSMWDKETSTILLRYQPKYQEGVGFRIGLKSDFAISAIYINSTPIAITNSKNNV